MPAAAFPFAKLKPAGNPICRAPPLLLGFDVRPDPAARDGTLVEPKLMSGLELLRWDRLSPGRERFDATSVLGGERKRSVMPSAEDAQVSGMLSA